jgi:hypothetical protein
MSLKTCGPVEAFLPAIVWRASQCGWKKIRKTRQGHDIWEKPNGERMVIRAGIEPLVPAKHQADHQAAPARPQIPVAQLKRWHSSLVE